MTTAPPPQQNAGLNSLLETIVAPASAFDRLAEIPTWGWAFIATSILAMLTGLLSAPIQAHLSHILIAQQAAAAANPQQAAAIAQGGAFAEKFASFGFIFAPIGVLVFALIGTVLLLIGNAIFGGKANFKQLWCATVNILVVFMIGAVVGGILQSVRGPDAFTSVADIYRNSLTLAALAPTGNIKLLAILAAITPFSLWVLWLNSLLMQRIGRLAPPKAWIVAALVLVVPALATAGFAKQPPGSANLNSPPAASASTAP